MKKIKYIFLSIVIAISIIFFTIITPTKTRNFYSVEGISIDLIQLIEQKHYECDFYNINDTLHSQGTNGFLLHLEKKYYVQTNSFNLIPQAIAAIEPGLAGSKEKIDSISVLLVNGEKKLNITSLLYCFSKPLNNSYYQYDKVNERCISRRSIHCQKMTDSNSYISHYYNNNIHTRDTSEFLGHHLDFYKNIKSFISAFNSNSRNTSGTRNDFHFWFQESLLFMDYNKIEINLFFDNGRKLQSVKEYNTI